MGVTKKLLDIISNNEKRKYTKLEDYEYEVIEALVKVDVSAEEIATALDISETRAKYEVTQAKERIKNARSKSK